MKINQIIFDKIQDVLHLITINFFSSWMNRIKIGKNNSKGCWLMLRILLTDDIKSTKTTFMIFIASQPNLPLIMEIWELTNHLTINVNFKLEIVPLLIDSVFLWEQFVNYIIFPIFPNQVRKFDVFYQKQLLIIWEILQFFNKHFQQLNNNDHVIAVLSFQKFCWHTVITSGRTKSRNWKEKITKSR